MARRDFDTTYRGGRVDGDEPTEPPAQRYPCSAHQCPMPGTLFTGGTKGMCAWHYGSNASDWPRITGKLLDWACVTYEVNEARRALTGEAAANPAALASLFSAAWERLQPLVPGWEEQLRPGNIRWRDATQPTGYRDTGFRETYADWAKRLEAFVGGQVLGSVQKQYGRAAA
jgi:hypothetical protein